MGARCMGMQHAACGMGDGLHHTGMVGIGFACVGVDLRVLFCTPRRCDVSAATLVIHE
jgi:hypothetical protein